MAKRKRSLVRRMLGFGVMAGAAYALWKVIEANQADRDQSWESQPFPFPPQPRPEARDDADATDEY